MALNSYDYSNIEEIESIADEYLQAEKNYFSGNKAIHWHHFEYYIEMPGSKAWNHDVLAQEWFYGLMTRPDMSIKVERKLHDMRILGCYVPVAHV